MSTIPLTSGTASWSIASMPWRSVTSAIPHPWQPPAIRSMTTASPLASTDRIAAPTDLPIACHGAGLRLTTVTRLPETMTSVTSAPGIAKSASASGEPCAASDDANRRTPPECTGRLTRNLQRAVSIGSAVIRISASISEVCCGLRMRSTPGGHRPQLPRRLHHMAERLEGLLPAARLQPAVRVHPDLAVIQHALHPLQGRPDLRRARHARRVDVVDPRTDLIRVLVLLEGLEQLRARARVLDRDDVGVHLLDHADDVVELAVTHVGVDLGRVRHTARRETERIHRPVEVRRPLRPPQRQALAQGWFIDLDHADPRGLEVLHLVADCEGQLLRGLGARLIVAHERPLQDGHRAGEHPLHRLRRPGLRVRAPAHRHRFGARHVAVDERRLHVSRAVRLHPAVLREGEALELLAEVLDHVVPL